MYFGAHVGSSGGVWKAIEAGTDLGCEAIQIFAGSPRTWAPTVYKEGDAARFRSARAASPIRFVVIHTIYLINLASAKDDFYEKSVTSLVGAVVAAEQLGADAIVTHVGSHQGAGFDAGLERVAAALRSALAATRSSASRRRSVRHLPRRRTPACGCCSRTPPEPAARWASTSPSSGR
jgi:deoxyribonuclease-4